MKFLVLNNPNSGKCMEWNYLTVDDKTMYNHSEGPEIKCSDQKDTN